MVKNFPPLPSRGAPAGAPGRNPSAAPVAPFASTPSLAAAWGVAGQRPCGIDGGGAALSRTQLGTPRGVPICLVVPGVGLALPRLLLPLPASLAGAASSPPWWWVVGDGSGIPAQIRWMVGLVLAAVAGGPGVVAASLAASGHHGGAGSGECLAWWWRRPCTGVGFLRTDLGENLLSATAKAGGGGAICVVPFLKASPWRSSRPLSATSGGNPRSVDRMTAALWWRFPPGGVILGGAHGLEGLEDGDFGGAVLHLSH